jgi:hypothetical protein
MKTAKSNITACFQFNRFGRLTGIFLNSENEQDEKILQRGLSDLLKPQKFSLLKRLFRSI